MAAARPRRTVQEIDYQVFNDTGKKQHLTENNMAERELEEGQLDESVLHTP